MNWMKDILGLKPSRDEFVEIAKKAIRRNEPNAELMYDKDTFSIKIVESQAASPKQFFLENAYAEYCLAPANRRSDVLNGYFFPAVEVPGNFQEALPNILPRVQSRSFYEEMILMTKTGEMPMTDLGEAQLPHRIIAEHFAVGLVYDSPQSVIQLNANKLSDWDVELEEVMVTALKNLDALTPEPFKEITPGVFLSTYEDTHDASRLMLLERVRQCKVQGRHVAMVPSRNTLVITGESDQQGQTIMLNIAEKVLQLPRPLLGLPLVLSADTWHPWQPNPDHPRAQGFHELRAIAISDIYNRQKDLLDRLHDKEGTDVFVATYMAMKDQSGNVFGSATWTEGTVTLLPSVDRISFVRTSIEQPKVVCTAPWAVVREVAGELMRPTGSYPERYLVDSFPSEDQISRMNK
jgi:uncharacterized protein YtpQ (UPF0354 family)